MADPTNEGPQKTGADAPKLLAESAGASASGGEKFTISDNMLRYVYGIGSTETDFSKREAYTEAYNMEGNNANVRDGMKKHHQSLAEARANYGDYGFYQNNHQDEIQSGVNGLLHGSVAGQTNAMGQYIHKMFPKAAALIEAGNFDAADPMLRNHWFGLKDHPAKAKAARSQGVDKIKKFMLGAPGDDVKQGGGPQAGGPKGGGPKGGGPQAGGPQGVSQGGASQGGVSDGGVSHEGVSDGGATHSAGGAGGQTHSSNPTVSDVAQGHVVHQGMSGDAVNFIQKVVGVTVDGQFGAHTALAVKHYQKQHGLTADGKVGPATMKVMQQGAPAGG